MKDILNNDVEKDMTVAFSYYDQSEPAIKLGKGTADGRIEFKNNVYSKPCLIVDSPEVDSEFNSGRDMMGNVLEINDLVAAPLDEIKLGIIVDIKMIVSGCFFCVVKSPHFNTGFFYSSELIKVNDLYRKTLLLLAV